MVNLADLLDSNASDEVVQVLRELVRIRSYNPPGEEQAISAWVAGWLANAGLNVTQQPVLGDRANVIGRLAGAGDRPAILMCAHLDTVPPGDAPWIEDPLGARLANGRIYGRGSMDTKGALAGMLVAARQLRQAGLPLRGDLIVLATVDEETNGAGARTYVESGGMQGVGAVIVGEPTALDVVTAHRGALWLEITTHGKPAHGSMPEHGINAILPMAAILDRIASHAFTYEADPLLRPPTINVGTVHGGTKINMVPDRCQVSIDIRTVPGQSHSAMLDEIRQLAESIASGWPGVGVEVRAINDKPPLATRADDPLIVSAVAVAEEVLGRAPTLRGVAYLSDGSMLAGTTHTPAVVFGPAQEGIAHQVDEYVPVDDLVAAMRFYTGLAARWLM